MAQPLPTTRPVRSMYSYSPRDRRAGSRRPYAAWERVGTLDPNGGAQIAACRCHDLSRDGFSYWTDAPPADNRVVLSLAGETGPMVLAAEVRHLTAISCLAEPVYLVGCRFVE